MSVTVEATGAEGGIAGRRGETIRSDVWIRVEVRGQEGIDLALNSRVEPYYGASIRDEIRHTLGVLGVIGALVEVEDTGALPFVLEARLEAAVVASGTTLRGDARPERSAPLPPPSPARRMRRSRLYLPGNEPKFFMSAGLYGPDAVILDLEDSVHPDSKTAARLLVRNALRCVGFGTAERMVRINQLPLGLEDLRAVVPESPDLILIPKVESAAQVAEIDAFIAELMGGRGEQRPLWLMPILESALGIENAFEVATASQRVVALTIGLEDYAADLGVPRTEEGVESAYARKRLVNAAKAAGVQAIDSVYGNVDDAEGLSRWGERSRALGFEGMGCIHPRQIPIIHRAFEPPRAQIEKALRIVEAFEKAQKEGLGVVSLGSKMIDAPVVKQAIALVERARILGLTPGEPSGSGETEGAPSATEVAAKPGSEA